MKVKLSGVLLRFVNYQREVTVDDADTIATALDRVVSEYPALKPVLYDGSGNLRSAHQLFVNGDQVTRGDLRHPVAKDDTVDVLTAIAGG
jgi:molybdopterin synthase sulfur carrier subunit